MLSIVRTLARWVGLDAEDEDTVARRALGWVLLALVSGLAIAGFAGSRLELTSIGEVLLVAAASVATGSLIGFLFAIPRTPRAGALVENGGDGDASERRPTGLEEIADWLTKIIIGVGLTELRNVPEFLGFLSTRLRLVDTERRPTEPTIVVLCLVYFWVVGFFLGYLGTRLVLAEALVAADRRARQDRAQIRRLAGGDLGIGTLSSVQQAIVDKLRVAPEAGLPVSELFPDFSRDTPEHEALRHLKRMGIVRPADGGSWQRSKTAMLTDLALRLENLTPKPAEPADPDGSGGEA